MEPSKSVFAFTDYRAYLARALPTAGAGRGGRARLAGVLRCQSAYISRVLKGLANLSPEQAVAASEFLGQTEAEADYFLLLVHYARAGSKELEARYLRQILAIQKKRELVSERVQAKAGLTQAQQIIYYSAWQYAAIHVLLLNSEFQTRTAIAVRLQLPPATIAKSLDFLVDAGLAAEKNGRFHSLESRIHLGKDSPLLSKMQTNWHMRAIHALDRDSRRDLFYCGPISTSRKDAEKIRAILLGAIEQSEKVVRGSGDEIANCIILDLFEV